MINERIPVWVKASVAQHFDAIATGTFPMYLEGVAPRETEKIETGFFELRLDGPYFTQISRDYWSCYVEINVLIQEPITMKDDRQVYQIDANAGKIAVAFTDIIIKKFGDEAGDDETVFGCMHLLQDVRDRQRIQINHFGQIEPKVRVQQATVEGHYNMEIDT